jgi:O-antigen/teichoic acid export membrane protein
VTSAVAAPPATRDHGLRRALALSSGGAAGARVTGAVGGVLAARVLGPTGRGQLAVLVFVATAASMAASAGIQFWVAREVARRHGVHTVAHVVRTHLFVMLGAVPVLGVIALPAVEQMAAVGPAVVVATIALATTSACSLVLLALPNGLRAMGVVALGTIAAGLVYVAGNAALLAVGTAAREPALVLVLAAAVVGNLVACAVALAWARSAPPGTAEPARTRYSSALRFGVPGGAGELVLLAMLRADVLLVAAFLPLRDVGLYAVATALAEVLWVVPDGVAQVVLPTTARHPEGAPTARLLKLTLLIVAAEGLVLVLIARPLIGAVFGAPFEGAARAVPLLVVASLGGGAWKVIGAEVVARGATGPRLTSASVGLVVMVLVDLVAIPAFGIAGAALGSACGYGVAAVVVSRAARTAVSAEVST